MLAESLENELCASGKVCPAVLQYAIRVMRILSKGNMSP